MTSLSGGGTYVASKWQPAGAVDYTYPALNECPSGTTAVAAVNGTVEGRREALRQALAAHVYGLKADGTPARDGAVGSAAFVQGSLVLSTQGVGMAVLPIYQVCGQTPQESRCH